MNLKFILSRIIFVTFIIIFVVTGCGDDEPQLVEISQQVDSEKNQANDGSQDALTDTVNETEVGENMICIHISGAVVKPGLYELPEGSRLYDAVMEAGGFSLDAAVDYSNLAEVLIDGVKYHIYTEAEIEKNDSGIEIINVESHYNSAGQLNINVATKDELMKLSGIGEAKAQAIIDYREEQGPFKDVSDLKNVSGIGDGLFSKISGDIIVK